MDVPETQSVLSRRAALAGATTALTATAGCVQRLRGIRDETQSEQLVVEITIPAGDYDSFAGPIARHLIDGLVAAGADYRLTPVPQDELYRQVLLGNEFGVYITRLPYTRQPDPDVLYPLLHSRFRGERGWQNPFGFTNLEADDLLNRQRRTDGQQRREAVNELQEVLARTQPFVPLVRPEVITGFQHGRVDGWEAAAQHMPYGLLNLSRSDETDAELRLNSTDVRITDNRNPISATHGYDGSLLELLYDPLVIRTDGELVPWLASEIQWEPGVDAESSPVARIELREGLRWHNGEPLTAEDVVFTYEFLADTSDGAATSPVPAPRFRGPISTVQSVESLSDGAVRLTFEETSRDVAAAVFGVPILPKNIWIEQTEPVSIAGIELDGSTTEALVWNNPEPVGSGPLQFEEATSGQEIRLSRFEDHFLSRQPEPEPVGGLTAPAFDELTVEIVSSGNAVVESLRVADVDGTLSPVNPAQADQIREEPSLSTVAAPSYASYHLGFNTRNEPFSDPNFRRTVGRLFDKQALADEVFGGYGEPIASPLAGTDWLAESLEWDGVDPATPFVGSNGVVDDDAAKNAFREIGYQYNADDELVL